MSTSPGPVKTADDLWAQALQQLPANEQATLRDATVGDLHPKCAPTVVAATTTLTPLSATTTTIVGGARALCPEPERLCAAAARKRDECDAKRWRFELHGRTYILRDVAEKVIAWLNTFKQVGDVAVQYDPGHAPLPWAGVRFLLEAVTAESKVMGALLVTADKAANLIGRCRIYESLYLRGDGCTAGSGSGSGSGHPSSIAELAECKLKTALVALYTVVLRLLATTIYLCGRSTATRALRAIFDPSKLENLLLECQALEARVDTEVSNCERARSAERHAQQHADLHTLLGAFRAPIVRSDGRVAELWRRAGREHLSSMLCWASDIPYELAHATAREGRTPNTAMWILRHERFREWRASSASTILWLHGIPGAGKTKLASMVVDHLNENLLQSLSDEALAYFYCDRNQRDRQDPLCIVRSYVRQLAINRSGNAIQPCLADIYEQKENKGFASGKLSFAECADLLRTLVDIYPQTTLVLDALDEADKDQRSRLVDLLESLVASSSKPVKVFVSSRRDTDIKRQFGDGASVAIEATDNASDISAFVAAEIGAHEKRQRRKLSKTLRADIISTLQDKSDGMFQWAALQIAQLLKLERELDMRRRIGKLPLGLQTAYDEIVDQIRRQDGSGPEVAERAIKWVMCSREPLSTAQLLGAVCQCPDEGVVIYAVDISADFVLGACRNLLVVDAERHTWRFSHLSVQEYFENLYCVRGQREWSYSSINALAAKVCLLLLIDGFFGDDVEECSSGASDGRPDDRLRRRMSSVSMAESITVVAPSMTTNLIVAGSANSANDDTADEDDSYDCTVGLLPIREYAEFYWMEHVRMGGEDEIDPRLSNLLKLFLGSMDDSGPAYRTWAESPSERLDGLTYELIPSSLACFAICHFGLDKVLTDWWHVGFRNPEQQNGRGSSLLTLATKSGSAGIVRHLLDRGVDVNRHDHGKGTPLAVASGHGHIAVVEVLLGRGADVHGECGAALRAAAEWGKTAVARMLLDGGADVNTYSAKEGSALIEVSGMKNNSSMVRLLLDRGADVNFSHQLHGTALQKAASQGNGVVAQLLLERGADVNAQGGRYGTVLQAAAYEGSEDVVELLLDHGAAINAQGGEYGTALQAASAAARVSVVQLLLNRGADICVQGGVYGSALQAASYFGRDPVVQLLIDGGADVNERCGRYGSPLQAAASRPDYSHEFYLFLDLRMPDAPEEDDSHDPPHETYDDEYLSVLRLLLNRGADVNAQGGMYGTAVQAAARKGNKASVRLLLDHGADVGIGGGKFGSALQAASRNGDEAVVKLLLDSGANISAAGGKFGSALQAASRSGEAAVVKLLLDRGADVAAHGGCYGTALQAACHSGCASVVELLLDRGAAINAQHEGNPKDVKSALHAAARSGYASIVGVLIDRGVDLNAQYGLALFSAAARDHTSVLLLLLQHRDKVDAARSHHEDALWIAEDFGSHSSAQLLREHCPELDNRYFWPDDEEAFAEEAEKWPGTQTQVSEATSAGDEVGSTMTRVRSAMSEAGW